MYALLIIIHVIACLVLIAVILLQAGRGSGLSDMMGGGQPQSILGTQTNQFMTRATEVCAVIFILTSLSLGILSTHRGKSLIEKEMMARTLKASVPVIPNTTAPVVADSAKAAAPAQVIADTAKEASPEVKTAALAAEDNAK